MSILMDLSRICCNTGEVDPISHKLYHKVADFTPVGSRYDPGRLFTNMFLCHQAA